MAKLVTSQTSLEIRVHTHHNSIQYWQLQDAKARLSELVKNAVSEGPQGISVRGHKEVVVISMQEYEALTKNILPNDGWRNTDYNAKSQSRIGLF